MAFFCSESSLAMALGIIEGWYDPAFPPKLSSEQIQDKLTKLRTFVEQNAETLRARRGDSILRRLRQSAPGEQTWYQFFQKQAKNFNVDHQQYLADIFTVLQQASEAEGVEEPPGGPVEGGGSADSQAAHRAWDEAPALETQSVADTQDSTVASGSQPEHAASAVAPAALCPIQCVRCGAQVGGLRAGLSAGGALLDGGFHHRPKQGDEPPKVR